MDAYKLTNICRTCMATTSGMTSIFSPTISPSIDTMITAISFLCPQPGDNLPLNICTTCLESLKQAYIFRKKIIDSNNALQRSQTNKSFYNYPQTTEIIIGHTQEYNVKTEPIDENQYNIEDSVTTDLKEELLSENESNCNQSEVNNTDYDDNELPQEINYVNIHSEKIPQMKTEQTSTIMDAEESHVCKTCNKHFLSSAELGIHEAEHYNYKCQSCDKVFEWKSVLDKHSSHHTDEKPYQCKYCQNKYARLSNLKRHLVKCVVAQGQTSENPEEDILSKKITIKGNYQRLINLKEQLSQFMTSSSQDEQDSANSGQGPIRHELKVCGKGIRYMRKRYKYCYDKMSREVGSKIARCKTTRVKTFCAGCHGSPFMCLQCFNMVHTSTST